MTNIIMSHYMHGKLFIADSALVIQFTQADAIRAQAEIDGSRAVRRLMPDASLDDFCITWELTMFPGFSDVPCDDIQSQVWECRTFLQPFDGFALTALYNYHDPSGMDGFATPVTPKMVESFHSMAEKIIAAPWSHGDICAENIFWDTRKECFRITRWQTVDMEGGDKVTDSIILARMEATLREWLRD